MVGAEALVTVIVIAFDVAVKGFAHDELEVITQVMISLLAKLLEVKVALFVPTLVPPFFHW
jgi:hypothetical protein